MGLVKETRQEAWTAALMGSELMPFCMQAIMVMGTKILTIDQCGIVHNLGQGGTDDKDDATDHKGIAQTKHAAKSAGNQFTGAAVIQGGTWPA